MTYILAIDTAFDACQIGLWREGACVATQVRQGGGKHDHILATMTEALLGDQGVAMEQVERILVTTGPGRFTGLRVGIAFARGLALVHDTPVTGVLTTEAMAWDMARHLEHDAPDAAVVLTVKRGESFVYGFRPIVTPITRVMDADLVHFFPDSHETVIAGVLTRDTRDILAQKPHISVLEAVQGPSLDAIYAVGMQNRQSEGPARPYYAA